MFVETFKDLAMLLGVRDPYRRVKGELNKVFLEKYLASSERLPAKSIGEVLELMATANGVDVELPDLGRDTKRNRIWNDRARVEWFDRTHVLNLFDNAERVTVVLDNMGEVVVDLLAAKWFVDKGCRVLLVARGEPYEVDVTFNELVELIGELGLDARGLEIVSAGSSYPFYSPYTPRGVVKRVLESDIVLVKGMGNAEAYIENPLTSPDKTVLLFRAKCKVFAAILGVNLLASVIVSAKTFVCRAIAYKEDLVRGQLSATSLLHLHCHSLRRNIVASMS